MAHVISVNASPERGTSKHPVGNGTFTVGSGMEGDGHAGNWHRQVSLFDLSALEALNREEKAAVESSYSENITTDGLELWKLPIGTRIEIGEAVFELQQVGKEFSKDPSEHTAREVLMHEKGVFCTVVRSGMVRPGDLVKVLE